MVCEVALAHREAVILPGCTGPRSLGSSVSQAQVRTLPCSAGQRVKNEGNSHSNWWLLIRFYRAEGPSELFTDVVF